MRTWIPLLRFAARRPLLALAVALALPIAAVTAVTARASSPSPDPLAGNPRAVLGRVWFDAYPEKRTDSVQIFIWLAGGIGIYESGSTWRSSLDIFDFERQGDKLSMTFLQDGKHAETRFTVTACDEKPPFDLCLDLVNPPRGPKRFYGFGDLDDMNAKIPWGRAMLRAAEARAMAK